MMNTYKYLGEKSAICFLTQHSVRFSQPKAFNDPFEMQPEFWIIDPKTMDKAGAVCNFVLHGHQQQSEKYILKNLDSITKLAIVDTTKLLSDFNDQIAIFCLTKAETLLPNNLLMWSHYAESHRGIVIEFKDSEFISQAVNVKYNLKRPVIDASLLFENEYISIEDLYYKHSCWEYEHEHRITCKLNECEPVIGARDQLGNDIYIKTIPLDSIHCIYVGCNASDEIKKLVFELDEQFGTHFMFLKVHEEEYKLVPYTSFGLSFPEIRELTEKLLFHREKI